MFFSRLLSFTKILADKILLFLRRSNFRYDGNDKLTGDYPTMVFEEEYEDVLKNIETIIIGFYKQNSELIDSEVDTALDWLIKYYRAVSQGRSGGYSTLKGISAELAENLQAICEVLLGQSSLKENEKLTAFKKLKIRTVNSTEIIECLKRLKSSVKFWTKRKGRQGYLNYVKSFIR